MWSRALLSLIALVAGCVVVSPAAAQVGDSQLSIGTNFVSGACLESRASDAAIVINKCRPGPQQALQYNADNGRVTQGDRCLTAKTKGEPLAIAACADTANQKWNFKEGGLRSDDGLCADVLNFQQDPGTTVIAWDCTGTDNQKFFVTRVRLAAGSPAPAATPAATPATTSEAGLIRGQPVIASYFVQGKCLSLTRGELRMDNCAQKPNQSFHFAGGISGQIVQDGKCLTTGAKGGALLVETCASRPEQDWTFTSDGTLRNRANLCADILNFDVKVGARVIGWDCTATDNQKFYPAVAARSGSFALGAGIGTNLRQNSGATTVSMQPGYSHYNITGSGGRGLSADAADKISGGQNDTVVIGGAGVLTVRFVNGLAASSVKNGDARDILPKDWSFFSGETAGTFRP